LRVAGTSISRADLTDLSSVEIIARTTRRVRRIAADRPKAAGGWIGTFGAVLHDVPWTCDRNEAIAALRIGS
jgi:hypothetical protein